MTISKYLILAGVLSAAALFAGPPALALRGADADQSEAPSESAVDQRNAKIQVGPWFLWSSNMEAGPANFFHATNRKWHEGPPNNKKPLDPQYINVETGLPHSLPSGAIATTAYFWNVAGFEGTWILEAIGDARISAGLARKQRRISKNRVEITNDTSFQPVLYVQLDHIGKGGLEDIRLYRKEDEARLDAGKHWSSRFVREVSRYDVVRTMDLQKTNGMFINKASDLPPVNYAYWGAGAGRAGNKGSLPLEALFALGVEADNEIWFQAPIHLGFPYEMADPEVSVLGAGGADNVDTLQRAVRKLYKQVLASDEWDKYADNIVAALEAAGYPESRMLYIGLGNEIWNFGGWGFRVQTHYADGIGEGFIQDAGLEKRSMNNRIGYGLLTARLMMAMDAAFARAGRNQARTHVIESQAGNDWGTRMALEFAKGHIEKAGLRWSDYAPRMGVSIASYWGGRWPTQMSIEDWHVAIEADPAAAAKARADYIINGPVDVVGTQPWVLRQFKRHKNQAANFGVELIGAYEGGSHDVKPARIPGKFYNSYLWGPEGARVNQSVNDALVAAFPGIILSNYVLAGPVGGQPWHDGPIGANTEMQRSWEKYLRK